MFVTLNSFTDSWTLRASNSLARVAGVMLLDSRFSFSSVLLVYTIADNTFIQNSLFVSHVIYVCKYHQLSAFLYTAEHLYKRHLPSIIMSLFASPHSAKVGNKAEIKEKNTVVYNRGVQRYTVALS